jgi:hypothetical protein
MPFKKEAKSMKQKILGAISISLSLGLLWQAVAQTPRPKSPCQKTCNEAFRICMEKNWEGKANVCRQELEECMEKCPEPH